MMLANDYPNDLDVMGQTITFDENTVFTSHVKGVESISDITETSTLEVSGYTTGSGSFYATNIIVNKSLISVQDVLRVRGIIETLGNNFFRIVKIEIYFDYSTTFLNIEKNQVKPGLAVVMAGTFTEDSTPSAHFFKATSIEAAN